ncbi:alpha/beta hydrolase [Aureimonas phyllosphaerae]|uniref:Acetyl esterase/lipase n=1 Tax=Aureimonas phyllosphaerae TaxID=1166078 RepID=A0A7W6BQ77_9HYPH|nr:alpha/beta hydrolase [Aureimonas phyllosphaerae]MBB3934897.1 acetyl esterase/lipase [Aureimonas phyllosphaerae]MBB3958905.1 acetyl esterase/lipase [Aureimonas phyllosphaerae]SFF40876.1 Acetyl esterase/lipase [Aureimonas phyllosphaerae]
MVSSDVQEQFATNGDEELRRLNAEIAAFQASRPSSWSFPIEVVREARRKGLGVFPGLSPDPDARAVDLPGEAGRMIPVRILHPADGNARGTYLHFHGGGWVFGEAVENDPRLRRLADATGLCVASVDYRLAPENPFPAGPDDCEAAALALVEGRLADLPTQFLAIGGESAGAHLSALTLLRLRDRHQMAPFHAANLVAGCFDLSMTPSVRNFGPERLILNTDDIGEFVRRFVPSEVDPRGADISPLYARLEGMPPALFSVGTRDLLLDDTLFMHARWLAAGNRADLRVQPDGCHVFETFASEAGTRSVQAMASFLNRQIAEVAASCPRVLARVAPD